MEEQTGIRTETPTGISPSKSLFQKPWFRISLLVGFLLMGVALVAFTPLGSYISDLENLQQQIQSAGVWGFLIFIAVVVVAALLNIPGTSFLVIAVLLYGTLEGAVLAYVASLLAAVASFYFGRLIGGQSLSAIKNKRIKKLISNAEQNPIRTIVLMRTLIQLSPLVSYSLALTSIKPKSYIIGNAIGILVPILYLGVGMYFVRDNVMTWLGVSL